MQFEMQIKTDTVFETLEFNIDMNYLEARIEGTKTHPLKDDPLMKTMLEIYKLEQFIVKRLTSNPASNVALVPALRSKLNERAGKFLEAIEESLEASTMDEGIYLSMANIGKSVHENCSELLDILELGFVIKCKTFNN
jgi:hypothetical protein